MHFSSSSESSSFKKAVSGGFDDWTEESKSFASKSSSSFASPIDFEVFFSIFLSTIFSVVRYFSSSSSSATIVDSLSLSLSRLSCSFLSNHLEKVSLSLSLFSFSFSFSF